MMKFSPLLYENMQRHPLGKLYNFSSYIIFTVLSFFLLLSNLENLSTNSHSSHWRGSMLRIRAVHSEGPEALNSFSAQLSLSLGTALYAGSHPNKGYRTGMYFKIIGACLWLA